MNKSVLINNKINKFDKKIEVSPDKSISIRCVLMASQAIGCSKIYNLLEFSIWIVWLHDQKLAQNHLPFYRKN